MRQQCMGEGGVDMLRMKSYAENNGFGFLKVHLGTTKGGKEKEILNKQGVFVILLDVTPKSGCEQTIHALAFSSHTEWQMIKPFSIGHEHARTWHSEQISGRGILVDNLCGAGTAPICILQEEDRTCHKTSRRLFNTYFSNALKVTVQSAWELSLLSEVCLYANKNMYACIYIQIYEPM